MLFYYIGILCGLEIKGIRLFLQAQVSPGAGGRRVKEISIYTDGACSGNPSPEQGSMSGAMALNGHPSGGVH